MDWRHYSFENSFLEDFLGSALGSILGIQREIRPVPALKVLESSGENQEMKHQLHFSQESARWRNGLEACEVAKEAGPACWRRG